MLCVLFKHPYSSTKKDSEDKNRLTELGAHMTDSCLEAVQKVYQGGSRSWAVFQLDDCKWVKKDL